MSGLSAAGDRRRPASWVFAVPAAVFLVLLALYPFLNLVGMSASDVSISNIVRGAWTFVGLHNYESMLRLPDFLLALKNTLIFVAIVLVVGMAGGIGAAVLLQSGGRLSAVALGLMVFTWAMPPVVLGSLWKFLLLPDGLLNAVLKQLHVIRHGPLWLVQENLVLASVALVNSWAVIPFSALVYRAALVDIPVELLDAAAVDGATKSQRFMLIKFPLLLPITLILVVLTVVYAFRSFDYIYVMTYGGPGVASTTLPFLSYRLSFINYKYALGACVAIVTVLFVLALAFVFVRATKRAEEGLSQ